MTVEAVAGMIRSAAADVKVYDTDASSAAGVLTAYPYIVVSGGVPDPENDAVGACAGATSILVRVTHVALTAAAVRRMVASTRAVLEWAHLPVAGGHEIRLWDSRGVDVDRDVTVVAPDGTAFPFYAVDIYRLRTA